MATRIGYGKIDGPKFTLNFVKVKDDINSVINTPLYDDPIILSQTTQYQHIAISHYKPFDEVRLFLNGNLQFCSIDEQRYHEPMVHPVMNIVPVKSRVLILGGGDGCVLREVLKYPDVDQITLVVWGVGKLSMTI